VKSNHQSLYSLNKNQNQSKTVAKAMKTSARQMEKGWGLHFSAVLSNAQSATNFKVS